MGVGKTVLLLAAALGASAYPTEQVEALKQAWDVIVVGAGPAGIVIADRMSEAGKKTLLLEQGGGSYYITGGRDRPDWLKTQELSRVDVPGLYKSIFEEGRQGNLTCTGKANSFTGCTIGGSSAINAELFFQPPASDFDRYFPQGWKPKDVHAAIKKVRKAQTFTDNPSKDGKRYLQTGYTAAKQWLVGNGKYKDVDLNGEPDDKTAVFGRPLFAYEGGQRSGPVKTYLQSALKRHNFALMSGVQVKNVIRKGGKATGVAASINNSTSTSDIKLSDMGQVVLSGGALFSPQLLLLSGIGPEDSLKNLTRDGLLRTPSSQWINNTAVGEGLFDNPNTFIMLSGPSIKSYAWNYTNPVPADRDLYLKSRSGPYAFAGETSAFWDEIKYPNGDIVGVQGTFDVTGFGNYTGKNDITLNVYATSGAKSLTRLVLDTKGIPGPAGSFLFSDPQDADAVATYIHKLFSYLPGSGLTSLNIPPKATKAEILKYITTPSAYTIGNVQHWSSSCRLGKCVDVNTKVKGMENLYVADASILPPMTVNPVMSTMIAAEKAAELILEGEKKGKPGKSYGY